MLSAPTSLSDAAMMNDHNYGLVFPGSVLEIVGALIRKLAKKMGKYSKIYALGTTLEYATNLQ